MKLLNNFVLLASDASVDKATNQLSIFKIIDTVNLKLDHDQYKGYIAVGDNSVKNINFVYNVVSSWMTDAKIDDDILFDVKIECIDPNGKISNIGSSKAIMPKNIGKLNLVNKMESLPITVPGKYAIKIILTSEQDKTIYGDGLSEVIFNLIRP